MTDPMDALNGLQQAIDARIVPMNPCELHTHLQVLLDHPNGTPRFTYAQIQNGRVQAIASVVKAGFVEGLPCFQIGYAVAPQYRGNGLGQQILQQALAELKHGMSRTQLTEFNLEAIVSTDNLPSNKIASRLISKSPVPCTDEYAKEPALQYLCKVKCRD
jgi:RimJ/RimL family protein N-acetyltransferase